MHLALYRKYRPRTFSEVISQPHITITLQNQIKSGQIAHAYLFTGSRGTGKTTCARIFAGAVNGVEPDSDSIDIIEIDAASHGKVDDVRSMREEAGYLPAELKYKVYIIDEVHMYAVSSGSFNALLKILEEPPPHVIFILATTDTHKIPATILSRCQRFDFHRINSEESADTLINIAEKEGVVLERDAAMLVARLSDGGMRDALSLLDVAASENTVITQDIIRDCAGIAGKEHLFAIADAIANKDGKTALSIMSGLYAKSKDPIRLIDELLLHFRNLMIIKLMPGDFSLLTVLKEEIDDYNRQSEMFTLEAIMDCLDKLEDCIKAKGRRIEAEICLMRLCVGLNEIKIVEKAEVKEVEIKEEVKVKQEIKVQEKTEIKQEPVIETKHETTNVLPQWKSILKQLDPFKAAMLEEATAALSGNTIVVTGGGVLKYFFDNPDNTVAIQRAARETTGKDYRVVFEQSAKQESKNELESFLDSVKESGIKVNIN